MICGVIIILLPLFFFLVRDSHGNNGNNHVTFGVRLNSNRAKDVCHERPLQVYLYTKLPHDKYALVWSSKIKNNKMPGEWKKDSTFLSNHELRNLALVILSIDLKGLPDPEMVSSPLPKGIKSLNLWVTVHAHHNHGSSYTHCTWAVTLDGEAADGPFKHQQWRRTTIYTSSREDIK